MIPGLLREAAAHVVVPSVELPELDDADRHHLTRVMRLRDGEPVTVTDGAGAWRPCRWRSPEGLEIDGDVHRERRPSPPVAVAVSPLKGDRSEWVVQKATELGADRIVPVILERTVVRWEGDRAARAVERWRRIAHEAVMQCRRVWAPAIDDLTTLDALAGGEPVVLADPGGAEPTADGRVVLIGPEGGLTPAEQARCVARVGLGDHVLRADTAAIATVVLVTAARARLPIR